MQQLNMIPFRRPDDYERFKKGMFNFWTPFEIPMGHDRQHYEVEMPDVIKRIAITNLANLTTSDVEIMDNCAIGLTDAMIKLGLADGPETRMVLNQQSFQEALHTASYQHIIESMGLTEAEQQEFYNMWQQVPAMRAKVEYAYDITDKLMSDQITFEDFLNYALFYWGMYEGGWFYTGFGVNFALAEFHRYNGVPCMQQTTEQLRYILRDEEQHIAFGMEVIRRLLADGIKPSSTLNDIISHVVELENEYAHYLVPDPVLGYSADRHVQYLIFILNKRLGQLGIESPLIRMDNPFPWRSTYELKQEANFFEKRVNEYQVGSNLDWGDAETGIQSDWIDELRSP